MDSTHKFVCGIVKNCNNQIYEFVGHEPFKIPFDKHLNVDINNETDIDSYKNNFSVPITMLWDGF